jgi:hypothetical protein
MASMVGLFNGYMYISHATYTIVVVVNMNIYICLR